MQVKGFIKDKKGNNDHSQTKNKSEHKNNVVYYTWDSWCEMRQKADDETYRVQNHSLLIT